MKTVLLAAGFGTRFRPLTYLLPKPMLPVCNKPLIGWIVEHAIDAGVNDFIVNTHHLPRAIEDYLPAAFARASFIFSLEDDEILGTGGALRRVRPLLERDDDFFVANGDTIQRPPFARLREARRLTGALAALTLRHPPPGDRFTPVFLDGDRITGFGSGGGEALMFSGSHCLSNRVFDYLPDRSVSGIVEHVYAPVIASGRDVLAGVSFDDPVWYDIGTPQRYLAATQGLLGDAPSLADPSARVTGMLTRSVAGARSVVEGTLTESVVWDDCRIGPGASLTRCIVGHGVELTSGDYTNAIICRDDRAIPSEYKRENGLVVSPF